MPEPEPAPEPKPKRPPAPKIDPELLAKTRELRDRVLEQVLEQMNTPGNMLPAQAKYNIARQIAQAPGIPPKASPEAA